MRIIMMIMAASLSLGPQMAQAQAYPNDECYIKAPGPEGIGETEIEIFDRSAWIEKKGEWRYDFEEADPRITADYTPLFKTSEKGLNGTVWVSFDGDDALKSNPVKSITFRIQKLDYAHLSQSNRSRTGHIQVMNGNNQPLFDGPAKITHTLVRKGHNAEITFSLRDQVKEMSANTDYSAEQIYTNLLARLARFHDDIRFYIYDTDIPDFGTRKPVLALRFQHLPFDKVLSEGMPVLASQEEKRLIGTCDQRQF